MTTMSEFLAEKLLPEWAKDELSLKLLGPAYGLMADAVADMQLVAATAGLIGNSTSPDDALPYVGRERGGLLAYPGEAPTQYRERLMCAAETFEFAGGDNAVSGQFAAAGYPGVTLKAHPNRSGPRGESPPYLSQYWIQVPSAVVPALVAPVWDSITWGYFWWDTGALPVDFVRLCLKIVKQFGDPTCFCRGVEIVDQDAKAASFPLEYPVVLMPLTRDGTNYGGVTSGSLSIIGNPKFSNDGLSFDGRNDVASFDTGLLTVSQFTISFRARFPRAYLEDVYPNCFFCDKIYETGIGIERRGGKFRVYTAWTEWDEATGINGDDREHTFTIVQAAENSRYLYVDGVMRVHQISAPTDWMSTLFYLGSSGEKSPRAKCVYRNLCIVSSALNDTERAAVEAWVSE